MNFNNRKYFFSALLVVALGGAIFMITKPYLPQRLFSEKPIGSHIVMDSLMLEAMNAVTDQPQDSILIESITGRDSLISSTPLKSQSATVIANQNIAYTPTRLMNVSDFNFNVEHPIDSTGLMVLPLSRKQKGYTGSTYLQPFFVKLKALDQDSSRTVRIAYYGDSMVDGDLIVQDLRSALQSRFGGRGVGFVSIKSESARSRYSVKHKTTGHWRQDTFMKSVSDSILYGINGAVFRATDSTAVVEYKASGIKNAYRLNSPQLFYGKGNDSAYLKLITDKDTTFQKIPLDQKGILNTVRLSQKDLKNLQLDFSSAVGTPLYGVDFFNEEGVTVDGFSNRGNSGLPLSLLKKGLIRPFQKELDYDLIVLQFGANVLSTKNQNFGWYASRMTRVVNHLKTLFPEVPILIMGTADKGTKKEDQIQTDSTVVRLLHSQQKYAAATQSGFLSLFHLMGGVNAMPAWREHKLANADFTHLSPKGSRKMGRLIFQSIMKDYELYLKAEKIASSKEIDTVKTTITDAIKDNKESLKDSITLQVPPIIKIESQQIKNDSLKPNN